MLALTSDAHDRWLASGSRDGEIRIWDPRDGGPLGRMQLERPNSCQIHALASRGDYLVSGSEDGAIRLWDVRSCELLRTIQAHERAVRALTAPPGADWLASASEDGTVKVWSDLLP